MGLLTACFGKGSSVQIQPMNSGSNQSSASSSETLVGMLTQAQQMELQSAFRRFDINGNGTIDSNELKTVMRQLGAHTDDQAITEILGNLDLDQNGQIEWTEFATLMADRWLRQDGDTDLELAMSLFTIDGDEQSLDVAKMRQLLTTLGEAPLSRAEVDQIVAMADPKGSGRVSTEDFRKLPCWQPPAAVQPRGKSPRRKPPAAADASSSGGEGGSGPDATGSSGGGATSTG